MTRIKGVVVGCDKSNGARVWTVEAVDPGSAHDGERFVVASSRRGAKLTEPREAVTFEVRAFGQGKGLKAIDVSPGLKGPETERQAGNEPAPISFILCEEGGSIYAWYADVEDEDQARMFLRAKSGKYRFVGLFHLKLVDLRSHELFCLAKGSDAAFECIRQMMEVPGFKGVIETLVTKAYYLGRKQVGGV